jgi:hypothetical protein
MTVSDFRANLAHGVGHGSTLETDVDELQTRVPSLDVEKAFARRSSVKIVLHRKKNSEIHRPGGTARAK